VGQLIDIYVKFDRPIVLNGQSPTLSMDLDNGLRQALFIGIVNNDDDLHFQLTTIANDYSTNLTYIGTNALKVPVGSGLFRQAPGTAVTEVIVTCPTPIPIARSGQTIFINTRVAPIVTDITSISANGRYAPGDQIKILVTTSQYVVTTGFPYLVLNLGSHFRYVIV
jgi:hypothetical protein